MKKTLLTLALVSIAGMSAFAQGKKLQPVQDKKATVAATAAPAKAAPATPAGPNTMKFKEETHDFGNLQQGAPAVHEFVFSNTGKEPIIVQNAKGSCGCTVPSYSKDPVAPGKTGAIKVSYDSKRVGPINKTVTVTSNVGTTVLHIKGNIEKTPETSVPENNSMIKTN